jgi:NAD(P)-dependent dehydrogenase (short-subunit alcohol dehydrogenase family)
LVTRIFITGSADGLGLLAAQALVREGHQVILHGRDAGRAQEALARVSAAAGALAGDLANIEDVKRLATDANKLGRFDAVIHNAGVYRASQTDILAVNLLAPYILTCLMLTPQRLIYLGSGDHLHGTPSLHGITSGKGISYADSKLLVLMFAKAVALRCPDVYANVVDPGWVPTKMGGRSAPDDLDKGYETQAWLAVSNDRGATVSGRYFHHRKEAACRAEADDTSLQDELLATCERATGVAFPEAPR